MMRLTELEAALGTPMSDLTQAIETLRGACGKLQVSIQGIDSDLETTNRKLVSALHVHSETSAFFESVLASIPNGVIVVDRRGYVVLFNAAAEEITGYRCDDMRGRDYSRVIGRGTPKALTPLYTLATGCSIDQEEKTLLTGSGEGVPVSFSTSLIMDSANNITGAIEVITDLRKVKLLEDEVSRTKTLATMGELAAVVAHEIRNPLGGMKGFATLLERDLADNEGCLAIVRRIHDGIGTLERIVTDLLEAGRDTKLRLEHTDLLLEIERVVDLMGMAAKGEGKDIAFEVSSSEEAIYCRIDRDRIRQAVTNLLRNASEAVGESGKVEVRVYTRSHKANTTNPSAHKKSIRDYICIEVTDRGPGISDEALEQIFAPFFTTKSSGTGLGLPTVRRIAALHGGEVKYSRVGSGGSRFTIEIPRR